jgi:osmotically-inducible protein OsmY
MSIKIRTVAAVVACVASASLGIASQDHFVNPSHDTALRQQIEHRFETSPTLKTQDLTVAVDDGVVTVTGVVATTALKARALQLAKVKGISRVESQIEVNATDHLTGIEAAGAKTKGGLDKGVDATVNAAKKATQAVEKGVGKSEEGAGQVAEKTAHGIGKAGDKLTDASITTRLKARFGSETLLEGSDVDVQTSDHVVTLTGRVRTDAARDRSIELARTLDGVQRVIDELHVERPY